MYIPEPYFGALISGLAGTIISKIGDAVPDLAERAKRAMKIVEETPPSKIENAVKLAIEEARQEMIRELGGSMATGTAQEMIAWLNHPPIVEQLVRQIVFRGAPDIDRLRKAHFDLPATQSSERLQALYPHIESFFTSIEDHLRANSTVRPLLREVDSLLKQMSLSADEQFEQIKRLMGQQLQRLDRPLLVIVNDPPLIEEPTPEERAYLTDLRKECNRIPLAPHSDNPAKQAALTNVYVDLRVDQSPLLDQKLARLDLPTEKQTALKVALETRLKKETPAVQSQASEGDEKRLETMSWVNGEGWEEFWKEQQIEIEQVRQAERLLTCLEMIRDVPRFVLLGNPGSGKSTLVNHLTFLFADGLLNAKSHWRQRTKDYFEQPLFPLRLILRKWSADLNEKSAEQDPLERVHEALRNLPDMKDFERLKKRLRSGNTLMLFDGLDETPTNDGDPTLLDRRRLILDSIHSFLDSYPMCRVLITSRVIPYRESTYKLDPTLDPPVPVRQLQKLDRDLIHSFLQRWYDEWIEVKGQEARYRQRHQKLLIALDGNNRQAKTLNEMAEIPLLLTMLAIVNAENVLPESRVQLYAMCIEQLLWQWEQVKHDDSTGAVESLTSILEGAESKIDKIRFERVLWELTFKAHEKSGNKDAELSIDDVQKALSPLYVTSSVKNKAWTWRMIEFMRKRSGIFVENDDKVFSFSHRSFQEYWAALHLESMPEVHKAVIPYAGNDIWREVILLTCGHAKLINKHPHTVKAIVDQLLYVYQEAQKNAKEDSAEDIQRLLLAGQAWQEYLLDYRPSAGPEFDTHQKILPLLRNLMWNKKALAAQRLSAGLLAADLGDLPKDLDDWVTIDATVRLGYNFKIGRYPVTNYQYNRFVDDKGYDREKIWWTCRPEAVKEILEVREDWPTKPYLWKDPTWGKNTQPVVGISWYEACAYCDWLNQTKQKFQIGENEVARLPTAAEWEFAARGTAERTYPWGKNFDPKKLNSAESELNQTSPVHMYREGRTPDTGIYDMAGNVWEWTNTNYEDWGRVLKGGAYYSDKDNCKASAADGVNPSYRYNEIGCRVVVVPISPGSES